MNMNLNNMKLRIRQNARWSLSLTVLGSIILILEILKVLFLGQQMQLVSAKEVNGCIYFEKVDQDSSLSGCKLPFSISMPLTFQNSTNVSKAFTFVSLDKFLIGTHEIWFSWMDQNNKHSSKCSIVFNSLSCTSEVYLTDEGVKCDACTFVN